MIPGLLANHPPTLDLPKAVLEELNLEHNGPTQWQRRICKLARVYSQPLKKKHGISPLVFGSMDLPTPFSRRCTQRKRKLGGLIDQVRGAGQEWLMFSNTCACTVFYRTHGALWFTEETPLAHLFAADEYIQTSVSLSSRNPQSTA